MAVSETSVLEALLRRDRLVVVTALLAVMLASAASGS